MKIGKIGTVILFSIIVMIATGCSSKSTQTDAGEEVPALPEASTYTINVSVVDSKENTALSDVAISTNTTTDANVTAPDTTGALGIATIESNQKININVVASKDGYVTTGLQVLASDSTEDIVEVTLKMVSVSNPPAGVGVVEVTDKNVSENGTSEEDIVVEVNTTVPSTEKQETTTVTIRANTELKKANGKPVTGALTVQVTNYSAQEENSTDAFPGGFAVIADTTDAPADAGNTTVENGENPITFQTAGFVSIEIKDENGNKVKNFSEPIEVRMQLDDNMTNPKTGETIKVGDSVPVWSYDDETAEWKYEQEGNVTDINTTDGLYDVVVTAKHLSYWNLDWHYGSVCSNVRLELINRVGNLAEDRYTMRANFVGSSGYLYSGTIYGDGFASMRNVPLNQEMNITATNSAGKVFSNNYTITECPNDTVTLTLNVIDPVIETHTLTVQEQCWDGSKTQTISNIGVYSYVNNNYAGYAQTDTAGQLSTDVAENTSLRYLIRSGEYQNRWKDAINIYGYYFNVTATTTDFTKTFELQDQFCPEQSTN